MLECEDLCSSSLICTLLLISEEGVGILQHLRMLKEISRNDEAEGRDKNI